MNAPLIAPLPARSRSRSAATALALLCAAWPAALLAQVPAAPSSATPATAPEETIELSPFVIVSESEKGYVATSSLAGSRVNTELKDIAAQIDVLTPEFLNDIGAINMEDAVQFSTNNGAPNDQNTGPNDGTVNTRATGRARGFDALTSSSDFYSTSLPGDFYNVERVTIANGPQSILFGLGNAGGAIDLSTKRALMRNRGEVSLRTDSEDSLRTTVDLNRVIVPGKFALRVVGLKSDINQATEGAYNDQKRLFGAMTWRPMRNTTVRLSAERMQQRASFASNYISYDFLSPWIAAGRPIYDNSRGNASITNAAYPLLTKNSNALRVVSFDATGVLSNLIWNGSALPRGPHQLAGAADTAANSLLDSSIYPTDLDPRVGGKLNKVDGRLIRGSIEQKLAENLFVEFGFNFERSNERRGGPFYLAETINIFADPNQYLPGGTNARPQTEVNPNAGRLFVESYPTGTELENRTREARVTASYEYDFRRRHNNVARWFGRHKIAVLLSSRIDEDKSQDSRAVALGNPAFATGDMLNNSRFIRTRYYLDPAKGFFTASGIPVGSDPYFGPWAVKDGATGESYDVTMWDHPLGRTSATGGSKKEIETLMMALQSFFWNDRINVFAGRRIDDFKSYLIDPADVVRGDFLVAGDRQGLYVPLSQARFRSTPDRDERGITYSYGAVVHVLRNVSVFASRSDNTGLPPGFLDPDNNQLPGIFSNGYDYGFRVSLKNDRVSMRVNFFREQQHGLIGDGQAVRQNAADVEQRLRGTNRPSGIADVAADGYDPVARGVNAYRSVENKLAHGIDLTLVARLTDNWDTRVTVGRQRTRVSDKSSDFNAWVARRLPVWQNFGGLGWDNVTISPTDPRTVHQYYDQDIATEILSSKLRNNLPRFRQREWRASLFTNYRFTNGTLKGLNLGGGARWLDKARVGFVQIPYPDGTMGDDISQPIYGNELFSIDLLVGYSGRLRVWSGERIGWRVQLNVRNVLDEHDPDALRGRLDGGIRHWGRVDPRQFILNTSFTF